MATDQSADVLPESAEALPEQADPSSRRWFVAAVVLSAIPVLRMFWWVRDGTVVQFADYWSFIETTFRSDGWPSIRALVHFQSQHLLIVPQLIYWLNMRLFGGSNITLGYFVIAVAAGQVALMWRWISRSESIPFVLRAALAVAVTAMLFAPHGAWNFLLSMSGTAWLVANLFAVASITLMMRDRVWPAVGLAVVATVTYGTGVLAWPAIFIVAVLRHRNVRSTVPIVATAVPVLIAYFVLRAADSPPSLPRPGLRELFENTAIVVGGFFMRDSGNALTLGVVVLIVTALLALYTMWARIGNAIPWIALGAYGVGNAVIIGFTRNGARRQEAVFLSSRYTSIAAFVWLSLLALFVVVISRRRAALAPLAAALIGVTALFAAFAGIGAVRQVEVRYQRQQELADSLRLGVAQGGTWLVLEPFPNLTPLLSAIGHHPFDSRYHGACDLLGHTVDRADLKPPSQGVRGGTFAVGPDKRMRPRPSCSGDG